MNGYYKTIFFLKSFVTGLFLPVLTLFILDRGATLSSLPLVMGCYSLMAILLEFPSGVVCDLYGRKNTFLFSEVLMLLAYIGLFFANQVWLLMLAMGVQGCGRAFSSGSLDALVIEMAIEKDGDKGLARVNGQLGLLESMGIAVGSVWSGVLITLGGNYNLNLYLSIFCHVFILILTFICVKEERKKQKQIQIRSIGNSFYQQMKGSVGTVWYSEAIKLLTFLFFMSGMVIMTVETYWQTGFRTLIRTDGQWLFGVVECIGFGATALGSVAVQKLLERHQGNQIWWRIFYATKVLLGIALIVFGLQKQQLGFVLGYGIFYLVLGTSSVTENTLLSQSITNDNRAGVMSLVSLIFQFGALLSSVLCSVTITHISISMLWVATGSLFLVLLAGSYMAVYRMERTQKKLLVQDIILKDNLKSK